MNNRENIKNLIRTMPFVALPTVMDKVYNEILDSAPCRVRVEVADKIINKISDKVLYSIRHAIINVAQNNINQ